MHERAAGPDRQCAGRRLGAVAGAGGRDRFSNQSAPQNYSIAYFGAAAATIVWLAFNNKPLGCALLGYIGFGLGMTIGRLLGNTANVLQEPWGYSINHWNVMVSFLRVHRRVHLLVRHGQSGVSRSARGKNISLASVYGIVFVLGIIPLWHRLSRIDGAEKITQWAKELTTYGYAEPDAWPSGFVDG